METFANQAVTTLSAAITTTTATSCSVIDATSFPATGNFRIKIDGEILIVTGVAGNTFTISRGAEGTTAATHASGASVIHLLDEGRPGSTGRQPLHLGPLRQQARRRGQGTPVPSHGWPLPGIRRRLGLAQVRAVPAAQSAAADRLVVGQPGQCHRQLRGRCAWSWKTPSVDANNPQLRILVRPILEATTVTMAFTFNGIGSDVPFMGLCLRQEGGSYDGYLYGYGVYSGYVDVGGPVASLQLADFAVVERRLGRLSLSPAAHLVAMRVGATGGGFGTRRTA